MPITQVNINQDNLNHNIAEFYKISPQVEIWPVIKSNAYGHGFKEIAQILDTNKQVSGFMVVNLTEALALSKLSKKPIMVLSYFERGEAHLASVSSFDSNKKEFISATSHQKGSESKREQLIEDQNISLPIYDLSTAEYLNGLGKKFLVNIKIDTGTSRLGFRVEETVEAINKIKNLENLEIFSLFTHYAESESDNQTFTLEQLEKFKKITDKFPEYKKHSACSAAALSQVNKHGDIIRLGISLYGLWPSAAAQKRGQELNINLKPVLAWQTKVIQVKQLKAGDTVGYNRTFKCKQDCQIAILPIGYNEGYDRKLSNKSEVVIKCQRCKVRGNVCMNLTMVELPSKMEVEVGETVELIGSTITAEELADKAQTINYEIVTRINNNLPRVVI